MNSTLLSRLDERVGQGQDLAISVGDIFCDMVCMAEADLPYCSCFDDGTIWGVFLIFLLVLRGLSHNCTPLCPCVRSQNSCCAMISTARIMPKPLKDWQRRCATQALLLKLTYDACVCTVHGWCLLLYCKSSLHIQDCIFR